MLTYRYIGIDKNDNTIRGLVQAETRTEAREKVQDTTDIVMIIKLNETADNKFINKIQNNLDSAIVKMDTTLTNQLIRAEEKRKELEKKKKQKKKKKRQKKRQKKRRTVYEQAQKPKEPKKLKFFGKSLEVGSLSDTFGRFAPKQKKKKKKKEKTSKFSRWLNKKQSVDVDQQAYEDLLNMFEEQEAEFGDVGQLRGNLSQKETLEVNQELDWNLIENPNAGIEPKSKEKFKVKVKKKEVIMITRRLQIMITSGVSLIKGLTILAEDADEDTQKMLNKIIDDIQTGSSFSEALSQFPDQFDDTYTSIVSIGESSGTLDTTLNDVIDMMEQQEEIKKKLVSAAIYPAIIGIVLGAVMILGSIFFIPMFEDIFDDLGAADGLPPLTRAIFAIANFIPWIAAFTIIVVIIFIFLKNRNVKINRTYKKFSSKFTLRIPIIKHVVLIYHMHTFASTVGMMISNGVRLNNSLLLAQNAITNVYIKNEIAKASVMMMDGHSLSDALRGQQYFDDILINIILVGEETGEMGFALDQISHFYKGELTRKIDDLMSMVEPLFMIMIGLIAAPVIVAIYMPILNLSSGAGM